MVPSAPPQTLLLSRVLAQLSMHVVIVRNVVEPPPALALASLVRVASSLLLRPSRKTASSVAPARRAKMGVGHLQRFGITMDLSQGSNRRRGRCRGRLRDLMQNRVPSAPPDKNPCAARTHRESGCSGLKSSGSVRCVKHNNPDQRDKSEGHKRGQRHELLPVVGLWTSHPVYL
jgi:hypothetical protein